MPHTVQADGLATLSSRSWDLSVVAVAWMALEASRERLESWTSQCLVVVLRGGVAAVFLVVVGVVGVVCVVVGVVVVE